MSGQVTRCDKAECACQVPVATPTPPTLRELLVLARYEAGPMRFDDTIADDADRLLATDAGKALATRLDGI